MDSHRFQKMKAFASDPTFTDDIEVEGLLGRMTMGEFRELIDKADRFEDAETLAQGWRRSTDMREVPAAVVATRCAEELEQVLHANHAKWDKPSTDA